MLDFNFYPYLSDVNTDTVFTLNGAVKLSGRFSFFSLLNLVNQDDSEFSDTIGYYTEQNLRWQVSKGSPFDLTLQLNFRTGSDNDRYRLGARWRLNDTPALKEFFSSIYLRYAVNLHAIQFDQQQGHIWQLEHAFHLGFPYWSDRIYMAGFIDQTFNETLPDTFPSAPIVAEVQFGYRLVENFYVIGEYRLNQYRRADVNNLAIGLEYKVLW